MPAEAVRSHREHPAAALLVIQVAGDSLKKDRQIKGNLYARFGVPEYWIVDLTARTIEAHRDPDAAGRYRSITKATALERLQCHSLPGLRVTISDLFD